MKYTKLIITAVLLVALIATTAFGAGAAGKKANGPELTTKLNDLDRDQLETPSRDRRANSTVPQKKMEEYVAPEAGSTYHFYPKPIVQKSLESPIAAGTYTVPGTWASLNAAAFALNSRGISGPVMIHLTSAVYNEAGFYISTIPGSDAVNTVTFMPGPATAGVTVNLVYNSLYGGGWTFAGGSNVIIDGTKMGGTLGSRDLTIQYDQTQVYSTIGSYGAVINLTPGTDSITIKNCVIKSMLDPAGAGGRYNVTVQGDAASAANYITIDNCEMTQSARNIVIYTNVSSSGPVTANMGRYWNITNNYIHDVLDYGMYLSLIYNCNVSGNTITNVRTLSTEGSVRTTGLYMGGFYNTIKNNKISNVLNQKAAAGSSSNRAFGINNRFPADFSAAVLGGTPDAYLLNWAGYSTRNRFINNTIGEVRSNVTGYMGQIGIGNFAGRYDTLINNTISFDGAAQTGGSVGSYFYGSQLHTSRTIHINNIIYMNRNNANIAVCLRCFDLAGNDYRAPSNNNVYYHPLDDAMEVGGGRFSSVANIYLSYGQGSDAHSLEANPYLVSNTNLHIDGTQPSSAPGNGQVRGVANPDLDGVVRATPPTIGAYEGTATGTQHDVGMVSLDAPGAAGVPDGLPFPGITVTAHNYTNNAEAGLTVNVDIIRPDGITVDYSSSVAAAFAPFEFATFTLATPWTPGGGPGAYTFKMSVTVAGDVNPANDEVDVLIPVAGMKAMPYTTGFETPADQDGWFGSGDWAIGSTAGGNTKLGGAHGGDKCYVTDPGPSGTTYATGGKIFELYTPYMDFTGQTELYLSFFHSIQTEPEWDRSWMYYSIDTGKTWKKLGALDEPAPAINWYSSSVYQNAAGANLDACFDKVSASGLGIYDAAHRSGFWTSNGDCTGNDLPTGPTGYIFQQIKLPADVYGKTYVRFKYVAFSDASSSDDGWAFDDFRISPTPEVFPPVTVNGTVYTDVDGSGTINGGDTPLAGVTVNYDYFGAAMGSTVTDVNGLYTFTMTLPGDWHATPVKAGLIPDVPAVGHQTVTYTIPPPPSPINGVDMAMYQGSISGHKWADNNDNALDDNGEPGLPGYAIELHKDSLNGPISLFGTATTDGNGDYTILAQPGTYVVKEIVPANSRRTFPANPGTHTVTVSGQTGGGSAVITGKNFGNFVFTDIHLLVNQDRNGDGVFQLPDNQGLPAGTARIYFDVFKNGVKIGQDTMSDGRGIAKHLYNDLGNYGFKRVSAVPTGWIQTTLVDSIGFDVTAGNQKTDSIIFLYFHNINVSGNVSQAKAGGAPIAGVTVTIDGTGGGSTVTDPSGNYSFTGVGPLAHTISETVPAGQVQMTPPGNVYTFTAITADQGGNKSNMNFTNFVKYCITGTKYRDRNNNGHQDAGEEPLAGWTITLTGYPPVVTDVNGHYQICDIGPGQLALTETPQNGYTCSEPGISGSYAITGVSGTDLVRNFGNFKVGDDKLFRTFTLAQLEAVSYPQLKPGKQVTPTKIALAKNMPNLANLLVKVAPGVKVGVAGALKTDPAWFQPKDYKGIMGSLSNKGTTHTTGVAVCLNNTGFDWLLGAVGIKPMLGKWTVVDPLKKKNDNVFAQLVTFQVNLVASANSYSPNGLSGLIYQDAGHPLNDMSLDQIAAYADDKMSHWQTVPYSIYCMLDTTIARINGAFAGTPIVFDSAAFSSTGTVSIPGVKSVIAVPFLRWSPTVQPVNRYANGELVIPTTYALRQNYPNPFNPSTMISFDIPEASLVTLKIYNVLGQEVATLFDRESFDAGAQQVEFDASSLASGMYLYRIVAEQVTDDGTSGQIFTQVKKMVLMK